MKLLLVLLITLAVPAAAGLAQDQPSKVYGAADEGVTLPQVVKQVKAQYTREAMQQRIEGDVLLDVVVKDDGSVGDIAVKESLDGLYGLDAEAVKAMKQWQFKAGTKDGKPVNVRVDVKMRFTLR